MLTNSQVFNAYVKILNEVQVELVHETESVQYAEYRRRIVLFKREHGIELNEKDEFYAKQVDLMGETNAGK